MALSSIVATPFVTFSNCAEFVILDDEKRTLEKMRLLWQATKTSLAGLPVDVLQKIGSKIAQSECIYTNLSLGNASRLIYFPHQHRNLKRSRDVSFSICLTIYVTLP
jgi:hypothetical protein